MRRHDPQEVLVRLFQRLYRSLPMYLAEAVPWTHPGDEQAQRVLAGVVADARAIASGSPSEFCSCAAGSIWANSRWSSPI